jgi:uncharacterized membrane protein YccC
MATNGPDPAEFMDRAQRMLRELFNDLRSTDDPWGEVTRRLGERSQAPQDRREPSAGEQRENLTFALATRAVEALEDLALNVAAMRQRFERMDAHAPQPRPEGESSDPDETDTGN